MARIDRLIKTLYDFKVPRAAIRPDEAVMLDFGHETKPLSAKAVPAAQVDALIEEIIPSDVAMELNARGQVEFNYTSPYGGVRVAVVDASEHRNIFLTMGMQADLGTSNPIQGLETGRFSSTGSADDQAPQNSKNPASLTSEGLVDFNQVVENDHAADHDGQRSGSASPVRTTVPAPQTESVTSGGTERRIPKVPPGTQVPLDKYLVVMFEEGCSDLHLTSKNPPLYRKDGDIAHLRNMPVMEPEQVEELLLPILPDRNYEEFYEVYDTDFAYEIKGVGRFRVNMFMDRFGPGAVFRIIPSDILTAEDLKLSQPILDLCYLNKGLVVVTGPTGSGKSTTLAAMIDYINRKRSTHIITIEDPIEFTHPNKTSLINQREIGVHTMGFKAALRAALREDPDIVLVGEMRDLETIAIAIETAETGHLVFGTLHTNTAPSTVDRIIDQFPSDRQAQIRTMLSESLKAVIAQTLCKKVGGGRVAALEVLLATPAVSNLIREGKTFQIGSIIETNKGIGMCTINDSLLTLVREKKITPEEAYMKAIDKSGIKAGLKRMGVEVNLADA